MVLLWLPTSHLWQGTACLWIMYAAAKMCGRKKCRGQMGSCGGTSGVITFLLAWPGNYIILSGNAISFKHKLWSPHLLHLLPITRPCIPTPTTVLFDIYFLLFQINSFPNLWATSQEQNNAGGSARCHNPETVTSVRGHAGLLGLQTFCGIIQHLVSRLRLHGTHGSHFVLKYAYLFLNF